MKVSGFTFVRNAIKYDYPVKEAIMSVLPLCDTFVVAVGDSQDATRELIQSIPSEKIRIVDTVWDETLKKSGRVLAVETDKAYAALPSDIDWAIYLQGDEVMHHNQLENILAAMERYKDTPQVEGLLFSYLHFYGSYDYVGDARKWYPKEVRVLRKRPDIQSYRDAQGFRKGEKKLNVVPINAQIFHYGWVKPPDKQADKRKYFESLYQPIDSKLETIKTWDYADSTRLKRFEGTHPKVMQERIQRLNWSFEYAPEKAKYPLKERLLAFFEKRLKRKLFEFRNYKIIHPNK